jgi:two-component system, OmpR family, sensor kinase
VKPQIQTWSMLRRLTTSLMALLGVIWLSSATILIVVLRYEINETLDSGLHETSERLLSVIETTSLTQVENGQIEDNGKSTPVQSEEEEYIAYQVIDQKGVVVLHSKEAPSAAWPTVTADEFSTVGDWRISASRTGDGRFVLQVGEKISHRYSVLYDTVLGLLLPFLLLLPLAALTIWKIVTTASKPLTALSEELGRRSEDNLSPLSIDAIPSELYPLVSGTNHLMAQLRSAIDGERQFASNSAHELRTPVAGAQAQAQVLADELNGKPEGKRAETIVLALKRLSRLVDKLLQLSRTEAGVASRRDFVNLTELVAFLASESQRNHPEQAFANSAPQLQPILVRGDSDMIAIAIQNLIDNAINHGRNGGVIQIRLGPGNISILNDCDVIPQERLQELRKRFVRGRTKSEGSGLGLAIVESIMQQSGGSLQLTSPIPSTSDGLEARLVLL